MYLYVYHVVCGNNRQKQTFSTSPPSSFQPEAAAEEAAVLSVVLDQLQCERGVLDVAVGKQQHVPHAAGRRQQAESPQGPPQLCAAPFWEKTLRGGRGAELSQPRIIYFILFGQVKVTEIYYLFHPYQERSFK